MSLLTLIFIPRLWLSEWLTPSQMMELLIVTVVLLAVIILALVFFKFCGKSLSVELRSFFLCILKTISYFKDNSN